MTFSTDRLNRLREDARMMRIYHDDHGIAEVIALCDAHEELQAELTAKRRVIAAAFRTAFTPVNNESETT